MMGSSNTAPREVNSTSVTAQRASSSIPFENLMGERLRIMDCLSYVTKKNASKRCRKALRGILQDLHGGRLPDYRQTDYQGLFRLLRFDLPGTWVWEVLARATTADNPSKLTSLLMHRFNEAAAGLSATQLAQAKVFSEQYDLWEKQALERAEQEEKSRVARREAEDRDRKERARLLHVAQDDFMNSTSALFSKGDVQLRDFDNIARQYESLFAENLTLLRAIKRLGLSEENKEALILAKEEKKKAEDAAATADLIARKEKKEWERSLVPSFEMPARLNITKTEYQKWYASGRLKPALLREFSKWGKDLEMPLFDPKVLDAITADMKDNWRLEDSSLARANRQAGSKKGAAKSALTRDIKQSVQLHAYAADFDVARGLGRTISIFHGPTNSGKSRDAVEALVAAESGVYLAPLRLLALEIYEKLLERGIPVNLITGEERILDPAAKHVCATVEMCDFETAVDVAVVDEMQMLGDKQRGWAWTAAILGVPGKQVFICGASHARAGVIDLLAQTGEQVTEQVFERKTPLTVASNPIIFNDIQAGDALVAFSRKEVLQFAAMARKRNFEVSVIYGALSPEVRRSQAQAFVDGRTQIVVATDAIGLGLNLPIRRMIFTATSKYDGVRNRPLYASEIQQIGGRAGRFGFHDAGIVTAFGKQDLDHIRSCMNMVPDEIAGPFPVMPTWIHTEKVLNRMGTKSVSKAFEFFDRISFGGVFEKADLSSVREKAEFIDLEDLSPWAVFSLACAPADVKNDDDRWVLEEGADALVKQRCLSLPRCPIQLDGGIANAATLSVAEGYSRRLALFAWMGCKFPGLVDLEGLTEQRQALTLFINRALVKNEVQFIKKQRKRYDWIERDDDYDD